MKLRLGAVFAVGLGLVLVVNGGLDASGPAVGVIPPPCDTPAAAGVQMGCFTGVVTVDEVTNEVANGLRSDAEQAPTTIPDSWSVTLASSNCPLASAMEETNPLVDQTLTVPNNGTAHSDVLAVYRNADAHEAKCEYLLSETAVTGFTTTYSVTSPFTLPDNGDLTGNDLKVTVTNSYSAPTSTPTLTPTPPPPVTTPPACEPFDDVSATNQFCDDIAWLKQQGITVGDGDGNFRPAAVVTRQAMAVFLYRYEHPGIAAPACATQPFTDVSTANAFCADIAVLKTEGVVAGYTNGAFLPNAPVARQSAAAFLYRVANADGVATACASAPFPDVSTTNIFCGDISWLLGRHITTGYPDGGYHPTAVVARQIMAAFLHRLYGATH